MKAADEEAIDGVWRRKGVEEVDQKSAEDEDEGLGDDLVEGVLQQRFKPAPEEPFHLRDDEEGDEDGADEDGDAGGDEAEGDHGQERHAGGGDGEGDEEIADERGDVEERWLFHRKK